jgi:uncharacterized membrane protein YkoI
MEETMQGMNVASCLALVVLVCATEAEAYEGEQLAQKAKITIDQARSIALKARHGSVADEELEKEKGGTGLRYSFDIKSNNRTYEVGVDAKTGKVLENAREGRHPD